MMLCSAASLTAYSGRQFLLSFSFVADILGQRIPWRKEQSKNVTAHFCTEQFYERQRTILVTGPSRQRSKFTYSGWCFFVKTGLLLSVPRANMPFNKIQDASVLPLERLTFNWIYVTSSWWACNVPGSIQTDKYFWRVSNESFLSQRQRTVILAILQRNR